MNLDSCYHPVSPQRLAYRDHNITMINNLKASRNQNNLSVVHPIMDDAQHHQTMKDNKVFLKKDAAVSSSPPRLRVKLPVFSNRSLKKLDNFCDTITLENSVRIGSSKRTINHSTENHNKSINSLIKSVAKKNSSSRRRTCKNEQAMMNLDSSEDSLSSTFQTNTKSALRVKTQEESLSHHDIFRRCHSASALAMEPEEGLEEGPVTSPKSFSSMSEERNYARSISFSTLEIRDFSIVLEDNPAVTSGPPVGLGWDVIEKRVIDLDDYESYRAPRREKQQLVLPALYREMMLKEEGYTRSDFTNVQKMILTIKKGRKISANRTFYEKIVSKFNALNLHTPTSSSSHQTSPVVSSSDSCTHGFADTSMRRCKSMPELESR